MLEKKFVMLALTLISIFTTLCMVNETYAKYVTSASVTSSTSIARWKVLVNNEDITLGSTSTNLITPEFPGSTDIAPNVLAPNTEGYFDIVLDGSSVDVSFRYTITVGNNPNSPVTELIATKYIDEDDEETEIEFTTTPRQITGEILLSDTNKVKSFRVYVKWDDSLNLMTNAQDTDTTVGNQKGMMDVSINVIQI